MDFKDYLKSSIVEINAELDAILDSLGKEVDTTTEQLTPLFKSFKEHVYGGKMLRGTLVKLGFELTDLQYDPKIIKIASALEILHTSFLIHDDIIDESPTRRGKPSLFHALGGGHYGISQAICIGNLGFFECVRLVSNSNFENELKSSAMEILSKTAMYTNLGEMLDVKLSRPMEIKKEEDVLTITKYKTASYSFVAPLTIGAIFGKGSEQLLKNIEIFGENLGISFQIQDDILGSFGNEEDLGKSTHSDIEEGKNTLLISYAATHANEKQKQILKQFYGVGEIDNSSYLQVQDVFRQTGSLDYSHEMAAKHANIAKEVIPQMTSDVEKQELLRGLADLVISRRK